MIRYVILFQSSMMCLHKLPFLDLLIFDHTPESFDEDVVPPTAPAVHTDLNATLSERLSKSKLVNWMP